MPDHYVYLAGPIRGCSYRGATDWREYVKSKLPAGVHALSPMRGKDFLRRAKKIRDAYPEHPMSGDSAIVGRDRNDVIRSDVVLCSLQGAEEVSLGTSVELGWADLLRKPVVLVMEDKRNPHDHPFVRSLASFVTDELDEAIEMVCSILDVEMEDE